MTSPSSSRFGTFFSRVETEREVLSIVNAAASGPKLHGLTAAAIDRWSSALAEATPSGMELGGEVVRLLHRIAIRAGTHADRSRAVFANESSTTLPVDDLVCDLRALCLSWCPPSSPKQAK
jgi:hypothetical protein